MAKDDPTLRAETANVYLKLAEIVRDITPGAKAFELYDQARRTVEEALAEDPGSEELRAMLGKAW